MNMNDLLNSLYAKDPAASSLEKTAEAQMLQDLTQKGEIENPYEELSIEELMKVASELGIETPSFDDTPTQEVEEVPELLQEDALAQVGGKTMAHSFTHEFGLMKEAMAQGLCRVCKTNPMDLDHTFVCSGCLSGEE